MLDSGHVRIDIALIAAGFTAVPGIGFRVAGRSPRRPVIGGSLFASNITSTTLIGLAGAACTTGMAVANHEWMAAVVPGFMSACFVPVCLRNRIATGRDIPTCASAARRGSASRR